MATLAPPIKTDLPPQGEWTYADWLRLPADGFKYEVIDGELYMSPPPSVSHQHTTSDLLTRMRIHALNHQLGQVYASPIAVRLPVQDVPVQPDIVYVSTQNLSIIGEEEISGTPDLVVEVLSPSNWMYDRGKKQEVYRQAGVPEYWLVDYRKKTVEVLVLEEGDYMLQNVYKVGDTAVSVILTNFSVPVVEIFRK
ncbi:MAG: Uma2 family endonuclease [Anaerolineae bacterium]|nr:Uma2 family endonuclease [Anaerolineae bacterium]